MELVALGKLVWSLILVWLGVEFYRRASGHVPKRVPEEHREAFRSNMLNSRYRPLWYVTAAIVFLQGLWGVREFLLSLR